MSSVAVASEKRLRAFAVVDSMPSELRGCVHEFGLPIVQACLDAGVRDPRRIRQLVHEIWAGAREGLGQRGGARNEIDWLLMQNRGSVVSYGTLRRVLAQNNMAIVPVAPTRAMLDASMSTVSGFNVRVTREEKHRRRLEAALRAQMMAEDAA